MEAILKELNIRHQTDVPLGPHTWYGVGGNARVMAHPSSVQQLSELCKRTHDANIPLYVLGSGANLLVLDQGVDGVVVKLDDPCFKQLKIEDNGVTVGSGYDLAKLILDTIRVGLAGLQALMGVPATVGGAVRMNAGGRFGEIGRFVRRVKVMDACGQVYYRDRDDLVFTYRKSNIVAKFILEVELELSKDDPDVLMNEAKKIMLIKKETQPLPEASAGCAFKNPSPLPGTTTPLSAGRLIDSAGLKGFKIGGAEVSTIHANFITAAPGCKAQDILAVMTHVQEAVLAKHGVKLEREVVIWPSKT
jgi:UDP-N-acetylmuramate dehydrogenase